MRKLKLIIEKINKAKFKLTKPPKKKILIFDDESADDLKYILKNIDFFLLQTRFDKVSTIYLSPNIIFRTIVNYRGNLWTAYILSMIEIISPNVVLTFIDNSLKFFEVAQKLNKKINSFAIQNGARYDLNRYVNAFEKKIEKEDLRKKVFIPNFFCFGDYEVEDYKKNQISVNKFYPVGSLRLSNFLYENKNLINKFNKQVYDILYISDAIIPNFDQKFGTEGDAERSAKVTKYVIRYALNNKKKIIFALKRLNASSELLEIELSYYKKFLNTSEYEFFLKNSTINFKKQKYLAYKLMLQSNLSISISSTILRENLSLGKKSVSVNFMKNFIFEFPIDGLCKIKNCNFEEFEKKLDIITKMSDYEFLNKVDGYQRLMKNESRMFTFDKIREEILKFV
jgi:surface carbohydrate biosynthesis protein